MITAHRLLRDKFDVETEAAAELAKVPLGERKKERTGRREGKDRYRQKRNGRCRLRNDNSQIKGPFNKGLKYRFTDSINSRCMGSPVS